MGELSDKIKEWESMKKAAAKNELKPTLNYQKFDVDKLSIMLLGDEHIGSRYYDKDMHQEVLEHCFENKIPIILMGDELETATRDSVGSGVYEQDEILEQQLEHFMHLYKPLAENGLVLGLHPGNHENRVYNQAGLNLSKIMAKQLDVPYFGWGKMHYFLVGKQGYTIYTTHGASGARMPHTKIKGVIDLANLAEAEIYAMGHLHQLSHHVKNFYSADLRNKKVIEAQKHFILTGSYLNHWGSYAHMKSLEPMRKGSPILKLNGEKHEIRVSL